MERMQGKRSTLFHLPDFLFLLFRRSVPSSICSMEKQALFSTFLDYLWPTVGLKTKKVKVWPTLKIDGAMNSMDEYKQILLKRWNQKMLPFLRFWYTMGIRWYLLLFLTTYYYFGLKMFPNRSNQCNIWKGFAKFLFLFKWINPAKKCSLRDLSLAH